MMSNMCRVLGGLTTLLCALACTAQQMDKDCGNRTHLVVAITTESVPFIFQGTHPNGSVYFYGIDIDLMEKIAENLDLCFTYKPYPTEYTYNMMIADVANTSTATNMMISGITITGSRLQVLCPSPSSSPLQPTLCPWPSVPLLERRGCLLGFRH